MKAVSFVIGCVVAIILIATIVPYATDYEGTKTLDVLIIDGQSNAEYWTGAACDPEILNEEYTEQPAENILYYGTSVKPAYNQDWVDTYDKAWTAYHLHNAYDYDAEQWIIGGYEPILGNTIAQKSGNDVLVVNMAIGGHKISQLLPEGSGGEYSWGVLDHALAEAAGNYSCINMVGVVWIQGEADSETPVADYKASFVELMADFESYGANEFYLVHTRDSYGGNANTAQEQLSEEYSNVHQTTEISETFTVANGMLDPNGDIHYTQRGRDAIAFAIRDMITVTEKSNPMELASLLPVVLIVALIAFGAKFILSKDD